MITEGGSVGVNVEQQVVTERYALYNADTVEVARGLPDRSVDFSVFSPPFSSLFVYSASERDMGNSRDDGEFWAQYRFLIDETARVMKRGRIVAIHVMDLPSSKSMHGYVGLRDFPGDVIREYQRAGFIYHGRYTIWKDPVTSMQRTKALGLLHKTLRKDSSMSRPGIDDTIILMRTPGENPDPIAHTHEQFPVEQWQRYASGVIAPPHRDVWASVEGTDAEGFGVVGQDINPSDTLQHRSAREHDDEKHIAPLQLSVIRRLVTLYSNPGEWIWSPFAGIGSEGYVALQEGRRFIGAELKRSYYEQAARNLASVVAEGKRQTSIFDLAHAQGGA